MIPREKVDDPIVLEILDLYPATPVLKVVLRLT